MFSFYKTLVILTIGEKPGVESNFPLHSSGEIPIIRVFPNVCNESIVDTPFFISFLIYTQMHCTSI